MSNGCENTEIKPTQKFGIEITEDVISTIAINAAKDKKLKVDEGGNHYALGYEDCFKDFLKGKFKIEK